MAAIHRDLAAGRWASMSLVEQLANIGSEVSRCLAWRRKGNEAIAGRFSKFKVTGAKAKLVAIKAATAEDSKSLAATPTAALPPGAR